MTSAKDGQPVPLSYLLADVKTGVPQPAQLNVPSLCSFARGLLHGSSVLALRSTA